MNCLFSIRKKTSFLNQKRSYSIHFYASVTYTDAFYLLFRIVTKLHSVMCKPHLCRIVMIRFPFFIIQYISEVHYFTLHLLHNNFSGKTSSFLYFQASSINNTDSTVEIVWLSLLDFNLICRGRK